MHFGGKMSKRESWFWKLVIFACGIGNLKIFVWEIWNTAQGIRNPTNDQNPESKSDLQEILESSNWNLESTAWNREIQDCFEFPYMRRQIYNCLLFKLASYTVSLQVPVSVTHPHPEYPTSPLSQSAQQGGVSSYQGCIHTVYQRKTL